MPMDTQYIVSRRLQLKLNQEEAATRAGWTKNSIAAGKVKWSELEHGRYPDPRLSSLEAIATALQCGIDDLLVKNAACHQEKPDRKACRPLRGQTSKPLPSSRP